MTPEELAALHARCFTAPPPWSAAAFAASLAHPGAFLLTRPAAFLLGRVTAGEAELLTLATAPEARRGGVATGLLAEFDATARRLGATTAFLEVAEANAAARALYAQGGWVLAGRRKGYVTAADGPPGDALVLHRNLAPELPTV